MVCTFIGNRDTPNEIKPRLKEILVDLIENKNVNTFYVGNHGQFDHIVNVILKELKILYNINYYVALAYIPKYNEYADYSNTVYFEELNLVPYKYRIVERNKLMIKKSNYVVAYSRYVGNSRVFKEYAEKHNKIVISV